ncbi:MAG: dockerin type I repeat-containing protein [Oscillospiraceae bacterium]|nr:dockerin type I repeat-containing protein [Oscillospiraceae bacterium]
MKKRLLALLTGILCCCACVGNLPVSAVDETLGETGFYVVSKVNPEFEPSWYCLHYYSDDEYMCENIYNPLTEPIEGEKTENFAYGDILLIDKDYFLIDSFGDDPLFIDNIESIKYLGNCRNVLETKELTLTRKENESRSRIKFYFTDENDEEYYQISYYYTEAPEIDMNTCNVGDKILASVYKDAVILPLEVYPDTTENLPGDIDGNGNVDITDVIQMNRIYVGCQKFTPEQMKAGDVNQDGRIDLSDSMLVLHYLVGLVDSLDA